MKKLIALIVCVAAVALIVCNGKAQSNLNSVRNIVAAQDIAVQIMFSRIQEGATNSGLSRSLVGQDTKALVETVLALQQAERNAYGLADLRDQAPQTMTSTAIGKAMKEAEALGVPRSLRNNLKIEWATAGSLRDAEGAITKLEQHSVNTVATAAATGGFFRAMPSWLGGTTDYANHRTPVMESSETRMERLERKLGLTGSVTVK